MDGKITQVTWNEESSGQVRTVGFVREDVPGGPLRIQSTMSADGSHGSLNGAALRGLLEIPRHAIVSIEVLR